MRTINFEKDGEKVEVTASTIGRAIDAKDLAEIIDTFLNRSGRFNSGEEVGLELRTTHRSLQRLVVEFSLGVLDGISQQEYVDVRNGQAIATAKKIAKMRENGELNIGAFI